MRKLTDLNADVTSHHIEGIAIQGDTPFNVALISHIEGNLWTGGCIDGLRLPDEFRYVVSLYPWEKYQLGDDTKRVEVGLYDSHVIPAHDSLVSVANLVNEFLAKGQTLVHCQAGLNRSALIAGLALILQGRDPHAAIKLLRERRCSAVLCNSTFEEYLLSLDMTEVRGGSQDAS
jgi:hypothetical protein